MEKTYTYDNAIIRIYKPDTSDIHIKKATKIFMQKVMKEKENNK